MQATSASILARPSPKVARKPSSSGSPEMPSLKLPGATEGLSHRIRPAETKSVRRPAMMPRGMSRLGSMRFLGGQRQLLDGEEQPDREGQGGERALEAERQQRPVTLGQLDGGAVGAGADVERKALELGNGQRGDPEHREAGERRQGDDHGDPEGQFDAPDVQCDEHGIAGDPVGRQPSRRRVEHGGQIGGEEGDDDGGRQHVFDVLAQAGDEAAPRTHRGAGKGVGAAGVRQRRAHLGDAEHQPEIHDGDHEGGKREAAPAAGQQAEVPARIMARDDGADAQRPQRGNAGIAAQSSFGEIIGGDLGVGILLVRHRVAISL